MAIVYKISNERPGKVDVEVVVIPMQTVDDEWKGWPPGVVEKTRQELRRRHWQAKWSQVEIITEVKTGRMILVAVIGLGQGESESRQQEAMRRGIATVVSEAGRLGLKTVGIDLVSGDRAWLAAAATEGVELVSYGYTEYSNLLKKKQKKNTINQVMFICAEKQELSVRQDLQQTKQLFKGVNLARDLVNRPASAMLPATLVSVAKDIVSESKFIKLDVLNRQRARREKWLAFLAVAQGSSAEPYVIHLKYVPPVRKGNRRKIWLVGKGITFDSGGLSIKPAEHMEQMKIDMSGAASVLGLFAVLEQLSLEVEVHGLIAACENMPSGTAYRPGDILTALNGKTIEVLNTDAEGRITLADALSFAAADQPDVIIDLATLTGACVVALGETIAGVWGNNEELKQLIVRAASQTGEGVETMPMPDEYRVKLDSPVADMQNIPSSRYGGAISAAMFLREFVGEVPWAHLDLAGPAYMEQKYISYWNKGATGFGVRLLAQLLSDYGQAERKKLSRFDQRAQEQRKTKKD